MCGHTTLADIIVTVYDFRVRVRHVAAVKVLVCITRPFFCNFSVLFALRHFPFFTYTHMTYRKLTQPVPGGGAIQTKLKLVEGWWLTWEATTLQTNWVPPN